MSAFGRTAKRRTGPGHRGRARFGRGPVLLLSLVLLASKGSSAASNFHTNLAAFPWNPASEWAQLSGSVTDAFSTLTTLMRDVNKVILPEMKATTDFHHETPACSRTPNLPASSFRLSVNNPSGPPHLLRGRALQDSPPIEIPPLTFASAPEGLVILAPNRTERPNPLSRMQPYTGGWDFFSKDYWASLAWATASGAILGLVWAMFGIGLVVSIIAICLCCPGRWHQLRDKSLRYSKKDLRLPLLFLLLGVLISCVGAGLMVAGGVKLKQNVANITGFIAGTATNVSNIVLKVTPIVRKVASADAGLNITIEDNARAKMIDFATKAESLANEVVATATAGENSINGVMKGIQSILFIFGCIIVGAVLIGLVLSLCHVVVLSNILTTFIWVMCFLTWVLVTVFLFVWLFCGDTSVSMSQISAEPTDLTKFNIIVPCLEPGAMEDLGVFTRFAASTVVTEVNKTVFEKFPDVFTLLRSPEGLCNPFGPSPNYTYFAGACEKLCTPYADYCNGTKITLDFLTQRLNNLKCNGTDANECATVQAGIVALQAVTKVADTLFKAVLDALPLLRDILKCAYISYLATTLSNEVNGLSTDALLLWIGFLLISVGAMVYSMSAPVYTYRKARYQKEGHPHEMEPIAPPENSAPAYESDHHGHEDSHNGFQVQAKPAPPYYG